MLELKDVEFCYEKGACYRYDLRLNAGEIVAVVGPSGSGKSTLFELICGFLTPSKGTIMIEEKSLLSLPIDKRPITILFQKHNLFEHLSVGKNILLGREDASDEQIETILKEVGLEGFMKRPSTSLSGGQQQRVALARALLRKEPILLLDEPFTGLDAKSKERMLELVETITKRYNLHTVMITHDREDTRIATSVCTMQDGVLVC